MAKLSLISNPGSASRKYALFDGHSLVLDLHFEIVSGEVVCTLKNDKTTQVVKTGLQNIENSVDQLISMLGHYGGLKPEEDINLIGLRVVAPSSFFLQDHVLTDKVTAKLNALEPRAQLHITATLEELKALKGMFPTTKVVGVSDSSFHATKPDFAWNYGLPIEMADELEIKRFGYHGLSVGSVVHILKKIEKVPPKLIVCHLGSGGSVTAVLNGKSVDNTMGYSPLEGLIMSTRVGTLDITAAEVIKDELKMDNNELDNYLNSYSGLLGLSNKSADIRELLELEKVGDNLSRLALETYLYSISKAIGQMTAALGGIDMLVFTGTVGERSAVIRNRVVKSLGYLDLFIDSEENKACDETKEASIISKIAHSKPIYVVPSRESDEIVRHLLAI